MGTLTLFWVKHPQKRVSVPILSYELPYPNQHLLQLPDCYRSAGRSASLSTKRKLTCCSVLEL